MLQHLRFPAPVRKSRFPAYAVFPRRFRRIPPVSQPKFQSFGGIRAGFGSARRVSGGHEGRWVRWQSGAADAVRCGGQLREVQRCLRKSSPFTSFSLAFGKLTIKLEILCKETKCRQLQNLCEKTETQVQGLGKREPTEDAELRIACIVLDYCTALVYNHIMPQYEYTLIRRRNCQNEVFLGYDDRTNSASDAS